MSRIVVLGSGAWGTAIALSLYRRGGHHVTLWSHSDDEARQIAEAGENVLFLPGIPLPTDLEVTADVVPLRAAEVLVSVIPSEFLRPTLARLRAAEPVSWVPVLNGWLVTRRDLALAVMRDSAAFTVDDPRFSTARIVGPSMLSLDGPPHDRHRRPFTGPFTCPFACPFA